MPSAYYFFYSICYPRQFILFVKYFLPILVIYSGNLLSLDFDYSGTFNSALLKKWIFLNLHFKCYPLSLVSPLKTAYPLPHPPASMRVPPPPPTSFCLPALAFPYTEAWSLHRTKGLFSYWFQTRPYSPPYAAPATYKSAFLGGRTDSVSFYTATLCYPLLVVIYYCT